MAAGAQPVMGEIVVQGTRPDQPRVFHVLATTVRDEHDAVRNTVAVLRDITSRKEVEEMKSNFLSVVSHELKTPLHSIKGFVDIILMGKTGRINDTQRDFLTIVKTQTTQLQNQINDLLEFSRLEAGQVKLRIETVSLPEITAAVVDKLRPQAQDGQVTLGLRFAESFPSIQGDRARLEQVLTNLVDNAIKFTPAGGTVTISGHETAEQIQTDVHDTGIGIPSDAQAHVFDRFYQVDGSPTRSYRGTGLGLTICKHIVEQHQGRIWVESAEGAGSTFTFALPKNTALKPEDAALDYSAFPRA
jgi:two-component system phosphate regulon sensor histidine kinase PhoR